MAVGTRRRRAPPTPDNALNTKQQSNKDMRDINRESESESELDLRAADGVVDDDDDDVRKDVCDLFRGDAAVRDSKKKKKRRSSGGDGTSTGNKSGEKVYASLLEAPKSLSMAAGVAAASASASAAAAREIEKKKWQEIPERELTPEMRQELRLLKLRSAADSKRFYKSNDTSKLPTRFHVGTVVAPAAEFYSGRLRRAERSATFVDAALADGDADASRRRRFAEIQAKKARFSNNKKRRRTDLMANSSRNRGGKRRK